MNFSIRNYPSFRNCHHHRHHQFHACSGCPRHSDTHCHIGKQSLPHRQRSVQDKLLVLQEHLAEEQSVLQWQLTISMMALGAGRASVIVGFSWPSESLWYPFSGDPTDCCPGNASHRCFWYTLKKR